MASIGRRLGRIVLMHSRAKMTSEVEGTVGLFLVIQARSVVQPIWVRRSTSVAGWPRPAWCVP